MEFMTRTGGYAVAGPGETDVWTLSGGSSLSINDEGDTMLFTNGEVKKILDGGMDSEIDSGLLKIPLRFLGCEVYGHLVFDNFHFNSSDASNANVMTITMSAVDKMFTRSSLVIGQTSVGSGSIAYNPTTLILLPTESEDSPIFTSGMRIDARMHGTKNKFSTNGLHLFLRNAGRY